MSDQISVVKALQTFFTAPPFGRKIEISEFKGLTHQDKLELRAMLIVEGYDVAPLKESA